MYCENCGKEIPATAKFCSGCGAGVSEINIVAQDEQIKSEEGSLEPEKGLIKPGIRGWLVLLALNLIISPLIYLYNLFTTYLPIFTDGTWESLTNHNSDNYISGIGGALIFEVIFHFLLLFASSYLLLLLFKNDKKFPKFCIIFLILVFIYNIIDYAAVSSIFAIATDSESTTDLGRNIIFTLIFVPYMFKSKLVKVTFVK